MPKGYEQYCGLARALDLVGGRWSLLIVRELLTGPKRFTELEQGLHGIATNVLSSRLRDLEEAGLVQRSLVSPSSSSVVYGLTPYGLELEDPVVHLGLWGSKSLGAPDQDDFFSPSSFALALRGAFRADRADGHDLRFELRIAGRPILASVIGGELTFPSEPFSDPHVVLEGQPRIFAELLAGTVDIDAAISSGRLELEGSKRMARTIFEIFRLPARERATT
jgi:DNA-binding HxlR family transcriptional regulator/putative sterol carrier protein